MSRKKTQPKKISVFPLSNFIIFPNASVPLNIFEPRYIEMINDSLKKNRMIGLVQPKYKKNNFKSKVIYTFMDPIMITR